MPQLKIGDRVYVHAMHIPNNEFILPMDSAVIGTVIADPKSCMPGVEFDCALHYAHGCASIHGSAQGTIGCCFWIEAQFIHNLEVTHG